MKNYRIFTLATAFFAITTHLLWAQAKPTANINRFKASVKEVTLFRQGAQLLIAASGNVPAGISTVRMDDLPLNWQAGSLQAGSNKDNLLILSVQEYVTDPVEEEPETPTPDEDKIAPRIAILQDSIERYQFEITKLNRSDDATRQEETLLMDNKSVTHSNTIMKSSEVEKMANIFRERLNYLYEKQLQNQRKRVLWQKRIKETNDKIELIRNGGLQKKKPIVPKPPKTRSVELVVKSETASDVTLVVRVQITEAGWAPAYDFLCKGDANVKLNLRGQVWQNSGLKWNNVKLKVSSGQPQTDGNKPELRTMRVGLLQPRVYNDRKMKKSTSAYGGVYPTEAVKAIAAPSAPTRQDDVQEDMNYEQALEVKEEAFASTDENAFFAEYTASVPYTIVSGQQAQWVDLTSFSLKSDYDYAIVPKLNNEAFLMASITGWEDLNLVNAPMNVYYNGTLVGKSNLSVSELTSDTLAVSLGHSSKVTAKRQVMKNYTSRQLIGTQRKLAQGYTISLRNNGKESTEVQVEDQLPISQDSRITVKSEDLDGGRLNADTGVIKWRVKLKPNETKKIKLRYVVEYPKELEVQFY